MESLRRQLAGITRTYIGSMVTDEMKTSLRDDLLVVVDGYLENIDCDIRVEPDEEDPSAICVTLVLDGSFILSISALTQLPEYLAHELEEVRGLASERLEELKQHTTICKFICI